ncbi:hypothetical protein EV182_002671 [Spiromyces aspiralis]|uniref:Uncharacterized protein n=1 Tax=Spiromyces aspiralis TaxID=68401 RepID=A0ACC1HRE2_9FUNG|nr:hypothetical protein EV182_002671 [Spiromyces aspiralis]
MRFTFVALALALLITTLAVAIDFPAAFNDFVTVFKGPSFTDRLDNISRPKLVALSQTLGDGIEPDTAARLSSANRDENVVALDRLGLNLYTKLGQYPGQASDSDIYQGLAWLVTARDNLFK